VNSDKAKLMEIANKHPQRDIF